MYICTCNQKSLSKIILNIDGSMVLLMKYYARKDTSSPTTCYFLLTLVPYNMSSDTLHN